MKYGSVCSGIEAATCAWHPLGWEPAFFSEIEPFPSAVLAHHYPAVPNLGDMTQFKTWPDYAINILVGGTPCQSFSVAGLRKGLDDPRGNLMLTFAAIAARYRPRWLVWENVPGVLSSNGGKDFASFLGLVTGQQVQPPAGGWGSCGILSGYRNAYGVAWRVLDAQYFGLAQRRRRVFVVGYLGDWRPAAAVLLERESLHGNPAPSREAGKGAAGNAANGAGIGSDISRTLLGKPNCSHAEDQEIYIPHTCGTLTADTHPGSYTGQDAYTGRIIPHCMATGQAGAEIGTTLNCNHEAPIVASEVFTLAVRGRGDTHNLEYRTDGVANAVLTPSGGRSGIGVGAVCFGGDIARTLSARHDSSPCADRGMDVVAVAFDSRNRGAEPAVGRDERPPQAMVERTGAIDSTKPWNVAYRTSGNDGVFETGNKTGALNTNTDQTQQILRCGMQVRRLTPRECERLQGFPDDYTAAVHRGKPAADGPRYKALGNSMAVPVMRWIGERIAMVHEILNFTNMSEHKKNLHKNTPKNRAPIMVTHDGMTLTIREWAERTGISGSAIDKRLRTGWPVAEALTTQQRKSAGKYQ